MTGVCMPDRAEVRRFVAAPPPGRWRDQRVWGRVDDWIAAWFKERQALERRWLAEGKWG